MGSARHHRQRDGVAQIHHAHILTPTDPYTPTSLQQLQHLQIQGNNYPHQQHPRAEFAADFQPQPTAPTGIYLSSSGEQTSEPLIAPQYTNSYTEWPVRNSHEAHHLSVEDPTQFADWGVWDFSNPHNDATSYRSSPHLTPRFVHGHKRASSSSSHASLGGPQTPRANTTFVPRVEVFDSEGQGYNSGGPIQSHWPEDIELSVSDEDIKHFHQVFGGQDGIGHSEDHTLRHPRDVQRLQDPRIRQLMMSQESNVSSSRMGPPALPRTESSDTDGGCRVSSDPSLPKLDRTMSDIYQDSLYNPNLHQAPASPQKSHMSSTNDTSPNANMIRERLAAANSDHLNARSQSPTGPITRERSPFKPNSKESPREETFPRDVEPPHRLGSAYRMREWNKVQRDRAAAAQHQPSQIKSELNEPPKTISPKEVALDYEEDEAASKMGSLFPDEPPVKRRKQEHSTVPSLKPAMTRESTRGSNASEISQPSFGSMATSRRESSQSNGRSAQMNYPFFAQAQRQASNASNATAVTETTNDFPAHLTPTESTKSEQEIPPPTRKRGLTAASPRTKQGTPDGDPEELTYTCTYHGCTKRFDSQSGLQKHKRDIHHSTAHHSRNASMTGASASPGASSSRTASVSTATPANTVGNATADPADPEGHTASTDEIADRNSQAGPHICNRINPSTGRPCNSHFSRPYDLTRHEDTIHNNKKQKVRCMYCKDEKTFSRNDALTRHMRVVHPDVRLSGGRTSRPST